MRKSKFGGAEVQISDAALFYHLGRTRKKIRLDDIQRVLAARVSKITYDEDFLIVIDKEGKSIEASELDSGFKKVEDALLRTLVNFPKDWRNTFADGQSGQREIWSYQNPRAQLSRPSDFSDVS